MNPYMLLFVCSATQDKGDLELPTMQETDKLEPTMSASATNTQPQPTAHSKAVSRKWVTFIFTHKILSNMSAMSSIRAPCQHFYIWVVFRKGVPRGVTMFETVLLICCQ